jgi:hypothetical protein
MSSSVLGSAGISRQVVIASAMGMLLAVSSIAQAQTTSVVKPDVLVQDRQPGQAAAQQPDPKDTFVANGTQGMILVFVKPDKAADFEAVMAKIKDAMAMPDKADDPNATPDAAKAAADLKAKRAQWRKQAAGWSVLKVAEPNSNGTLTYIWNLDPAVAGTKYDPTDILYSSLDRAEADVLFGKLSGALAGANKWTITKLVDMKSGG